MQRLPFAEQRGREWHHGLVPEVHHAVEIFGRVANQGAVFCLEQMQA
jgi:hypothetical protein